MISLKTRSVRVARWLASATEAMDRAGKTLVLGLLACLAATLMAATPTLAQQITSTSWSPNPVVGPGQTITFTVFFNSGTRVITSLTGR
ncbi:MAG: hypothetical protein K2Y04_09295 [Caulobacteraceae bacterium]|nr:hypothetical protein [Caulobacteraceae bacterium]